MRRLVVTITAAALSTLWGCSFYGARPTIWRPHSTPDVANLWDLHEDGEFRTGIHSFCVSGIALADTVEQNVLAAYGLDRPLASWLKVGSRIGILFGDADATVKLYNVESLGIVSALQLRAGYNSPYSVCDASVVAGKVLNPYRFGKDPAKPTSIIFAGCRFGSLRTSENQKDRSDRFWAAFVGTEIWFKKIGAYASVEHLDPSHPARDLWPDPKGQRSYLLVTSGLKLAY